MVGSGELRTLDLGFRTGECGYRNFTNNACFEGQPTVGRLPNLGRKLLWWLPGRSKPSISAFELAETSAQISRYTRVSEDRTVPDRDRPNLKNDRLPPRGVDLWWVGLVVEGFYELGH